MIKRADIFIASLGLEAYRVGGSVRAELLGVPAKDADYMIRGVPLFDLGRALRAARPGAAVKPLTLRDGRQAGWRVTDKGIGSLEIMLPRTEVGRPARKGENAHRAFDITVDHRVPLAEDAKRRDFTFNALYKSVRGLDGGTMARPLGTDVLDPTGRGLYDLQHKLIQTTHNSSFRDDPLRTLRALRFVATLGFDVTMETKFQMDWAADAVTGLSAKGYASGTVLDELSRMLMGDDCVKALRLARDTGVLASILPELMPMLGFKQGSRYHDLTTDEHTFVALETAVKVDAPLRVRWALLFHDSGKPAVAWVGNDGRNHYYARQLPNNDMIDPYSGALNLDHEEQSEYIWRQATDRLSVPKELREDVAKLVRHHMVPLGKRNPGAWIRRQRVILGDDLLRDLLLHRACDLAGKGSSVRNLDAIGNIAQMQQLLDDARIAGVPAKTGDLEINGNDAMTLGHVGRNIGNALREVLDEVVVDPTEQKMSREWQLGRLAVIG